MPFEEKKTLHPHSLILIFIFSIMCLRLFHSCIAFSTVKFGAVNISVNTCYFQSFRCLHITPDVLQQVQLEQGDKRAGRERSTALSSVPPVSKFDSQQWPQATANDSQVQIPSHCGFKIQLTRRVHKLTHTHKKKSVPGIFHWNRLNLSRKRSALPVRRKCGTSPSLKGERRIGSRRGG